MLVTHGGWVGGVTRTLPLIPLTTLRRLSEKRHGDEQLRPRRVASKSCGNQIRRELRSLSPDELDTYLRYFTRFKSKGTCTLRLSS